MIARNLIWLVIGLFILTACITTENHDNSESALTGAATASVNEDASLESAPTVTKTVTAADSVESPVEEAAEAEATAEKGKLILTDDDRSSRLRSLTASWGTNWNLHTVAYDEILSGGPPRDGIPAIDDPQFISSAEAETWLADNEPVIALEIEGDARAYPLQLLTWHEIANDVVGGVPVVVTFCPLCNSALVFDRRVGEETFTFGVSGLLRNSDLIMYDRTTETLWQQFTGEGIVGDLAGEQLDFVPSALVSFAEFRAAYPQGVVLSRETGFSRDYGRNPYAGYDAIDQDPFLFTGVLDGRLPAMARVVTVYLAEADVAVAYPLSTLSERGVIHDNQGGQDIVVFHADGTSSALGATIIAEAEDVGATGVYDPNLHGEQLTFTKTDGVITDKETGSTWNVLGQATAGELAGDSLTPIVHGDHFWFSWAAFRPDTIIYE